MDVMDLRRGLMEQIKKASGLHYDTGTFTLAEDVRSLPQSSAGIPHNLGKVPKCVIIWQSTYNRNNLPVDQINMGYVFLNNVMDLPQRLTSTTNSNIGFYVYFNFAAGANSVQMTTPISTTYMPFNYATPTAECIYLPDCGVNLRWRANVTYHYFVSDGWW